MSNSDNNSISCGKTAGLSGGGSNITAGTGEPLRIIKTQLVPHPLSAVLQRPHSQIHSPNSITLQAPLTPTPPSSIAPNSPQTAPIQLKNSVNLGNLFSLNPVAAKISHIKTATKEGVTAGNGGITLNSLAMTGSSSAGIPTGTIVSSATMSAIKVGGGGTIATTIASSPIALNTQACATGATSIRAIGAGGQSTQVRVVMGNLMTSSMIKQLENAGSGRTQISAFPTAQTRSLNNTSITVTRSANQTAYMPRANVTATPIVGVGVPTGQRLVAPIRSNPTSVTVTGSAGAPVGNFVRSTAISRNSTSPATTVISPATSTTWMAANPTGQVQLIRAIPHQSRQRSAASVVSVSGTVVTTTSASCMQPTSAVVSAVGQQSTLQQQATIQAVSSVSHAPQPQQTYLATVLPPRQHQATLVYSSNVATSQPLAQAQFNSTSIATAAPRFAVATPLANATGTTTVVPRQIRPIPLGKSFSATKLNTTNISIRTPNLPQLTPTLTSNVTIAGTGASNSPRSTTVTGVCGTTASVIPSTNLSTTRIIQLQQQPNGTTQQIIGSTGRLATNVMLQPIIVNTSGGSKFGIRPPVTMATKVQPSLTITQLGIGKLPSSATNVATSGGGGGVVQQQTLINGGNSSPSVSVSTATITATNLTTNAPGQLVNVSQAASGQLITAQNIAPPGSGSGNTTVVPLGISTRGAGGNIITGTVTPIKNASAITMGKVMTQAQLTTTLDAAGGAASNSASSTGTVTPANVYIHHAAMPQRSHVSSNNANVTVGLSTGNCAMSAPNSITSNVLTSTGNVTSGTFLQPGSTIYYESVPASSVQVCTGVLSLTTTTATSTSTMSLSNQMVSSAANLSISSIPFVTHAANGGGSSTATFTVVPSAGGRTIGQVQIPVSSAAQLQALPVRFSQMPVSGGSLTTAAADTTAVSQSITPQLIQQTASMGGVESSSQIIIPSAQHQNNAPAGGLSVMNNINSIGPQTQHMLIPLQTSIKMTTGNAPAGATVVSNFLRKRETDGSPIRAAKNLGPTFISMGSISGSSPAASSVGSSYSLTSITSSNAAKNSLDSLNKKERVSGNINLVTSTPNSSGIILSSTRTSRTDSPASSDGSTTVSANSSPGVDQQIQDNNVVINRMVIGSNVTDTHFNPINELYANHHHHAIATHLIVPGAARNIMPTIEQQSMQNAAGGAISMQQRLNGGVIDCPPRKRTRRSTNDSQLSSHSQTSLSLPPPLPPPAPSTSQSTIVSANTNITMAGNATVETLPVSGSGTIGHNSAMSNSALAHEITNGKENTKPVEYILKRPRKCTLLSSYKQNWKSVHNHFQRYTDIKPREERKPTIMDLASQSNVLGKINGWKIFHLKSQMEDLCENESLGYEKLSSMLKQIESHGITNEIERISDLLKGNMQRSKIIVDGVNEAQHQIMRIFDHKAHISDIINRCASKRNFKKRDKTY